MLQLGVVREKQRTKNMNSQVTTEVTTVEELVAHERSNRGTGTVLVTFPENDYLVRKAVIGWDGSMIRPGKTKISSPKRHLKLLTDKAGAFVRFNGLKWDITGVKALVMTKEDGTTYRHLMVTTISAR
jgi:hypothetical protein